MVASRSSNLLSPKLNALLPCNACHLLPVAYGTGPICTFLLSKSVLHLSSALLTGYFSQPMQLCQQVVKTIKHGGDAHVIDDGEYFVIMTENKLRIYKVSSTYQC